MHTTDVQHNRATDAIRETRRTFDDPFASPADVSAAVEALFADLIHNADDLSDESDDPRLAMRLVFHANRLASARDALRDLLRRNPVTPTKPRVVEFDMVSVGDVSVGDWVWFNGGDEPAWRQVVGIEDTFDGEGLGLHMADGSFLPASPAAAIRRQRSPFGDEVAR